MERRGRSSRPKRGSSPELAGGRVGCCEPAGAHWPCCGTDGRGQVARVADEDHVPLLSRSASPSVSR
eukprot:scaffold55537_cov57-Phaeocystis_antarctica.AAC.3